MNQNPTNNLNYLVLDIQSDDHLMGILKVVWEEIIL